MFDERSCTLLIKKWLKDREMHANIYAYYLLTNFLVSIKLDQDPLSLKKKKKKAPDIKLIPPTICFCCMSNIARKMKYKFKIYKETFTNS